MYLLFTNSVVKKISSWVITNFKHCVIIPVKLVALKWKCLGFNRVQIICTFINNLHVESKPFHNLYFRRYYSVTDFLIMEWHFTANSLTNDGVFRKKGESSGEGEYTGTYFLLIQKKMDFVYCLLHGFYIVNFALVQVFSTVQNDIEKNADIVQSNII